MVVYHLLVSVIDIIHMFLQYCNLICFVGIPLQDPNINAVTEASVNTVRAATIRLPEQSVAASVPSSVNNSASVASTNNSPKNTNGNVPQDINSSGENVLGPSMSYVNQISIPSFVQNRPPGKKVNVH